jgi:hypothetical protein
VTAAIASAAGAGICVDNGIDVKLPVEKAAACRARPA